MAAIKQTIKNINTYMKRIASELGIEINVPTYLIRFAAFFLINHWLKAFQRRLTFQDSTL
ncbi:hypothetical protein EFB08_21010 [Rufibacter latericius]|uniref:Uncharacterized protein n=1 Tax=Rufibacter latericius TaxID=2487040 RepID=A0A3M9MAK5_9BACT|nr:hypothetical protein EFB08_21010 [Rufibacter latericius]